MDGPVMAGTINGHSNGFSPLHRRSRSNPYATSHGHSRSLSNGSTSSGHKSSGYAAAIHEDAPRPARPAPKYGERLLPQVMDELALYEPDRVYATVPRSSDLSDGFRDVKYPEFARAVNNCAWWLEKLVGRSESFETLAYMGIADIRYAAVWIAAIKCGYKLLVPSVRNSGHMNVSLLDQTKCTNFFYSTEVAPKVRELQDLKKDLHTFEIPLFDDLVRMGPNKIYPYTKTFAEAERDPVVVVHSSGSTGAPKPITMYNGTFTVPDRDRFMPQIKGRKNQNFGLWCFKGERGGRFYSAFPAFHLAGLQTMAVAPIFCDTATIVLGPADRPPSGELLHQIMEQVDIRATFCPPSVYEQFIEEPGALERVQKQLDWILYAGGPLSPTAGNALSKVTDLCQFYGSTEIGPVQALVPLPEYWSYIELHPMYGADMQPMGDGSYEMVLHKDPKTKVFRGLSHNFPDLDEWRTRDLFRPHPTQPNLWRFHGRTDDIIVLSNGEKFNPVPMESIITGHPRLSGAIVIGQARFQASLVVEPKDRTIDPEFLIEDVWPIVEEANEHAPGQARIIRSKILVASPDRPFHRAAKGTIVRKATTADYEADVDRLFADDNDDGVADIPILPPPYDLEAMKHFVRAGVKPTFAGVALADDADFYVHGLDSLMTLENAARLKAGLRNHYPDLPLDWLSGKTLYAHPTVDKLSRALYARVNPDAGAHADGGDSRAARLAALVEKYTHDLPAQPAQPAQPARARTSNLTVALTGSTGSLGTHLLQVLLDNPKVARVVCLNRAGDARARHERAFAQRGLGLRYDLGSAAVEFLQADFGAARLGLAPATFAALVDGVDAIVHNAWKVDFNHSVESFEEVHIRGVRRFIDWSLASPRRPHIFFVSSVSSVGNWPAAERGAVPERALDSFDVAQPFGYGESKHVAERMLTVAAERSGVPATALRVGQIGGPLTVDGGVWNRHEWFPALIQTSKSLGRLPNFLPDPDWIPVDTLARIIQEIMHDGLETNQPKTYNLVNPRRTTWDALLPPLEKWLGPDGEVVPLGEWIDLLERCDMNSKDELACKPAMKILDCYKDFLRGGNALGLSFETANGVAASKTMAALSPVRAEWMEMWLKQWAF